jgi:hypothetical protein
LYFISIDRKENVIIQFERELDQERRMADNLITNMVSPARHAWGRFPSVS